MQNLLILVLKLNKPMALLLKNCLLWNAVEQVDQWWQSGLECTPVVTMLRDCQSKSLEVVKEFPSHIMVELVGGDHLVVNSTLLHQTYNE